MTWVGELCAQALNGDPSEELDKGDGPGDTPSLEPTCKENLLLIAGLTPRIAFPLDAGESAWIARSKLRSVRRRDGAGASSGRQKIDVRAVSDRRFRRTGASALTSRSALP